MNKFEIYIPKYILNSNEINQKRFQFLLKRSLCLWASDCAVPFTI